MKPRGTILISTFSDEQTVRDLARKVLDSNLCACVNYTKIQSMYLWKGKREEHAEYLALFKTTGAASAKLKKAIAKHHPYEVPEILELSVKDVSSPYLSWLAAETSAKGVPKNRNNSPKRRYTKTDIG
jgi:periplasmic divalent cation tolerance protein